MLPHNLRARGRPNTFMNTEISSDLINDLGNDLAFAFFVEKRDLPVRSSRDLLDLMVRICEALEGRRSSGRAGADEHRSGRATATA